ncbi:GAF domain-containing protein, partial [Streptosporangium sp. NPDC023825]|uniref:GAF domain-containing sensor histidine kinase n=1 Tax=Streptosporangium sp. NPDC023825 TaxID=3154909 RepID=UPI0034233AC9
SAEVTTSLLSGAEPNQVLTLIARRARQMAGADVVAVLLPDEGGRVLRTLIADGEACDQVAHAEASIADSLAGQAFTGGVPLMVTDPCEAKVPIAIAEYVSLGPVAAVPIGAAGSVRGVLSLGKRSGRIPFSQNELHTLHSFAGQAAIALELAERRMDAERLSLLEDRDRIAKDLHDVVIQRLFAVAMTLMSAVRLIERPEVSSRVQNSIDELDGTIRQIRSTIFALQASPQKGDFGLRAQIVTLVEGARGHLGFMPGLEMKGRLDSEVSPRVAEHLLAALREALSNVVRHAQASKVDVSVDAGRERLVLTVADNGIGLSADGRRSGLRNLQERAERLGGSFTAGCPSEGGTRLVWNVPLGERQSQQAGSQAR